MKYYQLKVQGVKEEKVAQVEEAMGLGEPVSAIDVDPVLGTDSMTGQEFLLPDFDEMCKKLGVDKDKIVQIATALEQQH